MVILGYASNLISNIGLYFAYSIIEFEVLNKFLFPVVEMLLELPALLSLFPACFIQDLTNKHLKTGYFEFDQYCGLCFRTDQTTFLMARLEHATG